MNKAEKEELLLDIFKNDMLIELRKNSHKGSILDFKDFNKIITEMEYHKAKLFLAIRLSNKEAMREYLADTANYLLAIGNTFDLYSFDREDNISFELNDDVDILRKVELENQTRSKLIN